MKFENISSHQELTDKIKNLDKSYLILYKGGSATSNCALKNLAETQSEDVHLFAADVSVVRDIHERYAIKTVPTLLVFEKDKFQNVVKGCNNPDFYRAFFESTAVLSDDEDGPRQPSVTVYSTPTCSWCNTLKSHLRKHKIRFSDIDVSQDPQLAEELVRKSGQQGVPQTEIDGQIIVGFDKNRINKLLNIN